MLNTEITPRTSHTATLDRPRVLVVVPDAEVRSALQVGLGMEGFEISAFADAARAELLVGQGSLPAAAILDAALPLAELTALVSRFSGTRHLVDVPVLLMGQPTAEQLESLSVLTGLAFPLPMGLPQGDVAALLRLDLQRVHSHVASFEATHVPADRLVRGLLATGRSARVVLADGRAELIVAGGRFLRATFDAKWGVDAVCRALALTHGRYQVSLEPVKMAPEFHLSLKDYAAVVLPRLSKWERTVQRGVPLQAVLQVEFKKLAAALPTMPDELNRLVQLCDGVRDTRAVIADSPFDEVISLEALTRLYLMGVLAPVNGQSEMLMPRAMPRLFEPENKAAAELMQRLFGDSPPAEVLSLSEAPVSDWFEPVRGAGLEVADPSAGWLSAPVSEAPLELKAELAPALSRQLEAFNVRAEVEPREAKQEEKPVELFSDGKDEPAEAGLLGAVESAAAARPTPPMKAALQPEALHPSRDARPDQRRIPTPVMMPKVTLAEAPVPAPRPSIERLAASFFARPSAPVVDPTLTSREQLEALEAASQPRKAAGSRLLIAAAVAVMVVGAAVIAEALMPRAQVPAAPAPVVAQREIVKAPEPVVASPAPVVEEAPAAAIIDVSEPLAEGTRAYEAGQFKKAVSMLEQVTADAPQNARGWLFLGLARYDLGNLDGAASAAEKALAIDSGNARAWILLASVQQEKGNVAGSKASLQKAIAADPAGPFAEEAKALLR